MKVNYWILSFILLLQFDVLCQGVIYADTSRMHVEVRIFDESAIINHYQGNPTYNYDDDPDYADGPISRFWMLVKKKFKEFLGEKNLRILSDLWTYILMGITIIGVIYHLARSQNAGFLGRREDRTILQQVKLVEEIGSVQELEIALQEAESKGNHRIAIRILFLRYLHHLSETEMIDWEPELTNHQLLKQVKDEETKNHFLDLISIYEHVWYGEYEVGNQDYDKFKTSFINFSTTLKEGMV